MDRLKEYEDTGLSPVVCANYKMFEDEAISKGVTFKRIVELMDAEAEGRLVVLPCKVGDTVWVLKKKCKYAGEDNKPWDSCNQYWDNVYHKNMWCCAGKDDEGKKIDCEKRDMEWYGHRI